jgi:hypothetical protein
MGEIEPVARLRRLAAGELRDEDVEWWAGVLSRYLDPFGSCSLDEAAGLTQAPGEENWRTVAKRAARDEAIRGSPGISRAWSARAAPKRSGRH